MIKFIAFCILFVGINGISLCGDRNATSKPVIDYCISQNGSLESRCCFQLNSTQILAIDLTDMNLNKVPDVIEFKNLVNVTVIDLRFNSQLKSSSDDYLGMRYLDYLILPEQLQCPGEKRAWEIIDQTPDYTGVVCRHQKDLCTNSTAMCTPANSYCVTNGPNHFLCLCKNSYYGYKCLRNGQFPAGTFFSVAIVITVALSTFFYMTHRRNVKKD
jgi:hypothetical protein